MAAARVQVVILAGGLGTRLGDCTRALPKALLRVARRPFIDWQLERLRAGGATDVVLCVGHLGALIRDHVGDGGAFGLAVRYSEDGGALRDTGGAVRHALDLLEPDLLVTYGDAYLTVSPSDVLRQLRSRGAPALMTVVHRLHTDQPTNCEVHDGRVVRYAKGEGTAGLEHLDYGMLGFSRAEVARWPADQPFGLEVPLADLAARGDLHAYEVQERPLEMGSQAGLRELEALLGAA